MKTVIATIILAVGLTISAQAQITEADIKGQLQEMGVKIGAMKKFYVNNLITGYNSGKIDRVSRKYELGPQAKLQLTERGIKKLTYKNGKVTFIVFYPYASIVNYLVSREFITINLKN